MNFDLSGFIEFLKEKISRKQATAVVSMMIVAWIAVAPDIANVWIRIGAMLIVAGIATVAIGTHFWLELHNPTPDNGNQYELKLTDKEPEKTT